MIQFPHTNGGRIVLNPKSALLFSLLTIAVPSAGGAQCLTLASGDRAQTLDDDYARVAELMGAAPALPRMILASSRPDSRAVCPGGPWALALPQSPELALLPVSLAATYNSAYSQDRNNGAARGGRGMSGVIALGATYSSGPFRMQVRPELVIEQNRAFTVIDTLRADRSPWAYPWHQGIDWPTRFGPDSYTSSLPGESFISVSQWGVRAAVSTESMWWGPGMRNSILMSNTAGGFPHAALGTSRLIDIGIGTFEAEAVWGRLSESDYFDTIPSNEHRVFTGVTGSIQPHFFPGLSLGGARVYYRTIPEDGLTLRNLIPFFEPVFKVSLPTTPENPLGNDDADQMIALYGRWSFPAVGFEAYGEWARNDHSHDLTDFLAEPDHSQAYNIGVQKVSNLAGGWLRVNAEMIHLGKPRTAENRPTPTYYTHSVARQGYTHEGQLLGASVGPGSDAQYLRVDWLRPWGMAGAWLERVRRDEDTAHELPPAFTNHDVEITGGLNGVYRFRAFVLTGGISLSSRRNRLFRYCNPTVPRIDLCQDPAYRDTNLHIPLSVRWTPGDF